ncbi:MAG TPA: hypothetical protein VG015_03045 [Candidatus Dormibacteraeota bacterium]|nr:hypothetical protein [Candidatus Dormibacteraeota bacterium]
MFNLFSAQLRVVREVDLLGNEKVYQEWLDAVKIRWSKLNDPWIPHGVQC